MDWLLEGILSIFPREKAMGSDFRLDTEQIKIVQWYVFDKFDKDKNGYIDRY